MIASGSALAGSIVTGWFTRSAGHRQAAAAKHAGDRQADALLHTVQATLDEQRRTAAADRRRQAYVDLLRAAEDVAILHRHGSEDRAALLRAASLVNIEGPASVASVGYELVQITQKFPPSRAHSAELESRYIEFSSAFLQAAKESLNRA
ncbi:hypothetical protein GCM10010255_81430 [Streptomyces coeruleofuscus]|uniref:Protein kilB n=1 Tax=Streptomyces coeruleofuscus TaxID=66879 RepID=A0ABP5WG58_9ACTN